MQKKPPKKPITHFKSQPQIYKNKSEFWMLRLTFREHKLVLVPLRLSSHLPRLWQPPLAHPLLIMQAGNQAVPAKPTALTPS